MREREGGGGWLERERERALISDDEALQSKDACRYEAGQSRPGAAVQLARCRPAAAAAAAAAEVELNAARRVLVDTIERLTSRSAPATMGSTP